MFFSWFRGARSAVGDPPSGEPLPSSGLVGVVLTELWLRNRRAVGTRGGAADGEMETLSPSAETGASASADEAGGGGRSLRRRLNACGCCGKKKLSVVAVEREEPVDLPESLR